MDEDVLGELIRQRSELVAALEAAETGGDVPETDASKDLKARLAEVERAIAELGSGRNA